MNWRAWILCLLGHRGEDRVLVDGEWYAKCSRCGDVLPWVPEHQLAELRDQPGELQSAVCTCGWVSRPDPCTLELIGLQLQHEARSKS